MNMVDTRNVQTVEIEKLNERIADDRQMLRFQDDSINKLLHICRNNDATIDENREMHETIRELEAKLVGKDATIDVQRAAIHVMSGGHGKRIIADNEMLEDAIAAAAKDSVKAMKLIRDRGNEIKELEDKLDQSERLIKDISVNHKERNAYLKSKLEAEEDKNRRLRYKIAYNPCRGLQEEIWELKDAIVEKNDKIKELKAKLAVYDSSKQEATGLNFDGVDDCIEILPRHTIDEADIPKSKWVRIISAYGMGEDITVIHDADADEDYIHDAFCSVECPMCGSRKIVVTIEGELEKIRCKECGKTALKHLKRGEQQ